MKKFKIISRKNLFSGFAGVDQLKFKLNDNNEEISRTVVTRPSAVAILLFNKDNNTIIFIKQFRAPVYTVDKNGYILEVPAGVIEEGESPLETVIRETYEETGYKILSPELIKSFYPTCGLLNEIIHLYFAVVTNQDKTGQGGGLDSESEYLEVIEMPANDTISLLNDDRVFDAKTLIAIQYFRFWYSENYGQ